MKKILGESECTKFEQESLCELSKILYEIYGNSIDSKLSPPIAMALSAKALKKYAKTIELLKRVAMKACDIAFSQEINNDTFFEVLRNHKNNIGNCQNVIDVSPEILYNYLQEEMERENLLEE